jgi:hypothetical protein
MGRQINDIYWVYMGLDGQKGSVKAGATLSSCEKGNEDNQLGTGFFVHHKRVSAVKERRIYW